MASTPIRFVDLPAQHADVTESLIEGLSGLIRRADFVGGEPVRQFEEALAIYAGTKYAVTCSDGTAALKLALLGAGIQPGDKVVVPANSFIASANAVVHAGGEPVLVDCDPRTYLIDLNQVEHALRSAKLAFVMPVHLYGSPCPMNDLLGLCDRWGAKVIEDNAQALGAQVHGRRTGSLGLAAGISFYPAKNLGAFGQGGAVLTNDEDLAAKARLFAEQGTDSSRRYYHTVVGYNDRLHTLQAFVLKTLLPKLDGFNAARLAIADHYAQALPPERIQVRTPDSVHVYHLFVFRCDTAGARQSLAEKLKSEDIGFGFHYPVPIHKQQAYPQFNRLSFPVAEALADTLISLPMHPALSGEEVDRVQQIISQTSEVWSVA